MGHTNDFAKNRKLFKRQNFNVINKYSASHFCHLSCQIGQKWYAQLVGIRSKEYNKNNINNYISIYYIPIIYFLVTCIE